MDLFLCRYNHLQRIYLLRPPTSQDMNPSTANFWYPGRASDLRATRLSISISSMSASTKNLRRGFDRGGNRIITSGRIVQFGANVTKNDYLHLISIEIRSESMHDVDLLYATDQRCSQDSKHRFSYCRQPFVFVERVPTKTHNHRVHFVIVFCKLASFFWRKDLCITKVNASLSD